MGFFVNDTATTEIYTLSLHDALPICWTFSCTCHFRLACGLTIFLFGESTFLFENFKKDQKLGEIRDEYFLFFRSFSQSFFYKGLCDGSFLSFSSDLRRKTFERKNVIFFCMDFTDPASDRTLESFFSSFLYGHFDNLL